METNSKKVLAALPSFEDYMALAEEVKRLSISKMRLENEIKKGETATFRRVQEDTSMWKGGKPVSVSYFENAYKHGGIEGELFPIRDEYAAVSAELESKKTQFEIYRQMQDMYRALAYQEKSMS